MSSVVSTHHPLCEILPEHQNERAAFYYAKSSIMINSKQVGLMKSFLPAAGSKTDPLRHIAWSWMVSNRQINTHRYKKLNIYLWNLYEKVLQTPGKNSLS